MARPAANVNGPRAKPTARSASSGAPVLRWLTLALCLSVAIVLAPLTAPLVLAVWFADLLRPAVRKVERLFGGRKRAAGALLVLVSLVVVLPLIGIGFRFAGNVSEFLAQLRAALAGQGSLDSALLGGGTVGAHPELPGWRQIDWATLARQHGSNVWGALSAVARASTSAAIGALVFVAALYTCAVDGERAYAWLEEHAPLPPATLARFASAFRETGRGLIVAGGGTALAQGALATGVYLAVGIPRALLLGPLTAVCAIIPFVGTGLVWIPLAITLLASGHPWRCAVVVLMGVVVHTLVDDLLRPLLARFGKLQLPAFVVLASMLGGAIAFGPVGALLGPLLVRLCVEALNLVDAPQIVSPSPCAAPLEPEPRERRS